jgi:hypothetical protein
MEKTPTTVDSARDSHRGPNETPRGRQDPALPMRELNVGYDSTAAFDRAAGIVTRSATESERSADDSALSELRARQSTLG